MAKSSYEANRSAAAEIMQSQAIALHLSKLAEKGKKYAESISPRGSGEYVRSFEADTRIVGDRQQAVIKNTAKHAVVVEVFNNGTGDRVMAKTAAHLAGQ